MIYSLLSNISRALVERVAHTLMTTLGLLLAVVVSAGAANAQAVNRPGQADSVTSLGDMDGDRVIDPVVAASQADVGGE